MDTSTLDRYDSQAYMQFTHPSIIEKDLQTLVGIIKGINSDGLINLMEKEELSRWINLAKPYENKQPYKDIMHLVREAIADNVLTEEESENIIWCCNQYIGKNGFYTAVTSGIQQLIGIVKGIIIDGEVNIQELSYLDAWLEENDYLKNHWPYDEIYSLTTKIIQDKVITPDEQQALLSFCQALVADGQAATSNSELLTTLKTGFYQIDPSISIAEKTFCITGVSKKYKRKEIAEKIELYGGYMVSGVSAKLDYLVVCDEKNSCWAFTCYGRKIEEAIKHRKQGAKLAIVHEFDLYDTLEGL